MSRDTPKAYQSSAAYGWYCILLSYWLCCVSLALLFAPHTVHAQVSDTQMEATQRSSRECASCRQRKQTLCVRECAAVAYGFQRDCRFRCINEYCTHRCSAELALSWPELSCKDCQEEEITLCQPLCQRGTPFEVTTCKKQCAAKRCEKKCELEKEPKTKESKPGSASSLEHAPTN